MKLKVLGSSSKGNCYILEGEYSTLILEAGVSFNKVKKALDFKLDDIAGCLITHEHKDHMEYFGSFIHAGIPVYASAGTMDGFERNHNINIISAVQKFEIGEFQVLAFDAIHDTKEPLNFLIQSTITGEKLLFITDSAYCKYKFKNIDYLMLECNYETDILDKNIEEGIVPAFVAKRIKETHMSLNTALELVKTHINLKKIILIHTSDTNSEPETLLEIFNKTNIETHIAKAGDEYAL